MENAPKGAFFCEVKTIYFANFFFLEEKVTKKITDT
jgi:hypothetical protein